MNGIRKAIVALAAVAIALRLFYPATHETRFGTQTDIATTLLQLGGILVIFGAGFYLASFPSRGRLRSILPIGFLLFGWLSLLATVAIGFSRFGIAKSVQTIHWGLGGLTLAGFVALSWLSWLALRAQRGQPLSHAKHQVNLAAMALVLLLLLGGLAAQHYQERRDSELQAKRANLEKQLDQLRYGVVEGERIGPVELGMSLGDVVEALAKRFDSGERLANGFNSYVWNQQPLKGSDGGYLASQFWNVIFDSKNQRAVIVAYGLWLPRPSDEGGLFVGPSAEQEAINDLKFYTSKGARFGDQPSTIEALYGKPSLATELKRSAKRSFPVIEGAANLRFHYASIRTEFQFARAYGLLSILIYAPEFSPDRMLRSR